LDYTNSIQGRYITKDVSYITKDDWFYKKQMMIELFNFLADHIVEFSYFLSGYIVGMIITSLVKSNLVKDE